MSSAPVDSRAGEARRKFVALDALRGVAALAVLLWHGRSFLDVWFPDSAYLAVDLFFLMSGFVVAYSYEGKLRSGLTLGRFFRVRMLRLYPMYVLGTLIMAAFFIVSAGMDGYGGDRPPVAAAFGFGVLMLPTPSSDARYYLFPLSPAAWSLFLEVAVNLVYAALVRWLSVRVLVAVTACSALGLAMIALGAPQHLDLGWNWASLAPGVARVLFSFSLGVLMYRFRDRLPSLPAPTPVILLAALLLLCLPRGQAWSAMAAFGAITLGFPIILAAALRREPMRFRQFYLQLGVISYPLYILHHGLLRWLNGASAAIGLDMETRPLASYALLLLIVALVWAALKLVDEPLRGALGARLRRLPGAQPQADA